jgi:hypothetical protein
MNRDGRTYFEVIENNGFALDSGLEEGKVE